MMMGLTSKIAMEDMMEFGIYSEELDGRLDMVEIEEPRKTLRFYA